MHILGKINRFWKNCNYIPGESCLQKKALPVTIVRSKICLRFFLQKHVISSVEMAVFEINGNKPVLNYIPWFLISIDCFRICSTIFVFNLKGRNQSTYNISNHDFKSQIPNLCKTKRTVIRTMILVLFYLVSQESFNYNNTQNYI